MPRRRLPLLLLVSLPALLLAGCSAPGPVRTVTVTVTAGAGGAGSSSAPSITAATSLTTACQLLSLKEAEAIVGTTLSEGVEGDPKQPSCTYNPDPKGTKTAQVLVSVGDGAKKTYDIDHLSLKHAFTDVPGVGDEAHQEDFAIYFRKGPRWAGISVVSLDDPSATKSQIADAAKVVASRLP
jgi:hypothetical protein